MWAVMQRIVIVLFLAVFATVSGAGQSLAQADDLNTLSK
jgi:hypothetical protein